MLLESVPGCGRVKNQCLIVTYISNMVVESICACYSDEINVWLCRVPESLPDCCLCQWQGVSQMLFVNVSIKVKDICGRVLG